MSSQPKFLDLCLEGKAAIDDIDDYIDRWHADPRSCEIHHYLGMTEKEYAQWLRHPDVLLDIIRARRQAKAHRTN